ncbi:hypothetical protein BH18GEM1_BH18GEM1_09390 [soil metagenome]
MAGRPYRGMDGAFESADLSPPDLSDDATLFALLLTHPDFLAEDVVFMADGRVLEESDPAWRTVLGWHRGGGPVLLGVTTGSAGSSLLVETLQLAEVSTDWPLARWDQALVSFWETADPALCQRVSRRWDLSGESAWTVEAWTKTVWGADPVGGRAAIALLAARVSPEVRRAVTWLAASGREIAAHEVRRMGTGSDPTYWADLVAGGWRRPAEVEAAPLAAGLRRETYVRHTGSVTAGLLSKVETCCLAAGSQVAWSGEDWVRFDGTGHSLRVFPGAGWVDLQFVGADEGTLAGLRYRYGVPVTLGPPPDAPPEVHLRLASSADFSPAVELLLGAWLMQPEAREAESKPQIKARAAGRGRKREQA